MSKIIIDNRSSQSDAQAVELVVRVIEKGRISNQGKQYCYGVTFEDIGLAIYSDLNKCSDKFIVCDVKSL